MNQTSLNPGPVGTKGLKWISNQGRFVILGQNTRNQLVTGLDPSKTYALRALSDDGGTVHANALSTNSRPGSAVPPGKDVTLTVAAGDATMGTIIHTGSVYFNATAFTASTASDVKDVYGDDALIVLQIVEVPAGEGVALLDGTLPA